MVDMGSLMILCCSLADPADPLDRMINVLRWWFSKDLKYISGKLIKPYNSILGETFKCWWDVSDQVPDSNDSMQQSYATNKTKGNVRVKCLNEQVSSKQIPKLGVLLVSGLCRFIDIGLPDITPSACVRLLLLL